MHKCAYVFAQECVFACERMCFLFVIRFCT